MRIPQFTILLSHTVPFYVEETKEQGPSTLFLTLLACWSLCFKHYLLEGIWTLFSVLPNSPLIAAQKSPTSNEGLAEDAKRAEQCIRAEDDFWAAAANQNDVARERGKKKKTHKKTHKTPRHVGLSCSQIEQNLPHSLQHLSEDRDT